MADVSALRDACSGQSSRLPVIMALRHVQINKPLTLASPATGSGETIAAGSCPLPAGEILTL